MTENFGKFFPLNVYLNTRKKREIDTLITAYSYEDRIIDSLKRSLEVFDVKKAILLVYDGETYLDVSAIRKWTENKKKMDNFLASSSVAKTEISCRHDNVTRISEDLLKIINQNEKILMDITGLTKNYILKLAQVLSSKCTSFLYTRSGGYRIPTKEEMSVSINRIEPLSGFEGYVGIDKNDLLVLMLGYEGNRSLAFLKKFDTEPVLVMIGNPYLENEEINNLYVDSAKKANRQLINVHRVALYETPVHSLNPFLFAEDLGLAVGKYPNIERYNICLSCLGTKLQTLGLYLYWKKNPQCQIWYDVPNKRFDFSSGAGDSWIIEFENATCEKR
jgi:hypothetical protein